MSPEQAHYAALRFRQEAREHKRLSERHRRAARRAMESYTKLCRAYGIVVITDREEIPHGRPTEHGSRAQHSAA